MLWEGIYENMTQVREGGGIEKLKAVNKLISERHRINVCLFINTKAGNSKIKKEEEG